MNRASRSAIVVAGLVLTLGGTASWGQVPSTNDTSDLNGNTGSGTGALQNNTTGGDNTAFGIQALWSNSTGFNNTASGAAALQSNTTGLANTASGVDALLLNTTGNGNIALGANAGRNLTTGSNNIDIGHPGVAGESSTIRVGSGQTRTFIAGIKGVPISGAAVTINNAGQLGIVASSARYKRDIADMRDSSQGLYQLRPVTFRYKQDPQGQRQYGLIAEEVAKVYPELVTRGAKGEVESVQYHELIALLLNEVQHQQQELTELKAQNERLQAALAQQHAAVATRLERLEKAAARTATLVSR